MKKNIANGKLDIDIGVDGAKIILRREGKSNLYKQWLEVDNTVKDAYVVYKNAINYNNKSYDVKIQITGSKVNDNNIKYRFLLVGLEYLGFISSSNF